MKKIWIIIKWEFLNRARSKLFLFTTFLFPIFLVGILYIPTLMMEIEPGNITTVALVYEDPISSLIDRFKEKVDSSFRLDNGNPQYLFNRMTNEVDAMDSVAKKSFDGYLFIPNDILESGVVNYYSHSLSNIKIYNQLRRSLNQIVIENRMIEQNIDVALVGSLSKNIVFETFEVDKSGSASESDGLISFFIPTLFVMILFMTIFMSGQLLLRSVMEERTNRTIEILLSSISADQLMAGKILGLGMLGLVQMIFYLIIGFITAYFKDIPIIEFGQFPVFMIYFVTGYIFYSSIYATLGTFFSSEQEAQQTSGLISIVAVLPIIFASYFITNPGSNLTVGLCYFPPITPFMMILRLGTGTVERIEIIFTTLLLIICCWGMIKLSGKIFRTAILLYGKKITLKEILKWLKT